MSKSQNGYPVLASTETFRWDLPLKETTHRHLILRPGNVGFVLTHFALWYHETIESILPGVWDEWGYAVRDIRGSDVISNHASGTAMDLNAVKHPLGVRGTLLFLIKNGDKKEIARDRINRVLKNTYSGVIRAGMNYQGRPDEMHYEAAADTLRFSIVAKRLRETKRGKRIITANPGYRW